MKARKIELLSLHSTPKEALFHFLQEFFKNLSKSDMFLDNFQFCPYFTKFWVWKSIPLSDGFRLRLTFLRPYCNSHFGTKLHEWLRNPKKYDDIPLCRRFQNRTKFGRETLAHCYTCSISWCLPEISRLDLADVCLEMAVFNGKWA